MDVARRDTLTNLYREELGYRFIEAGGSSSDIPVVCLHGILGTADEWLTTVECLADHGYRVIVPAIPFEKLPLTETNVKGVTKFVRTFTQSLELDPIVLVGNSLGGQIALRYQLSYPESVAGLVLAGSAGLYEVSTSKGYFRREDREYLRQSAARVFFNESHADDALIDRIYAAANNRDFALRLVRIARDSQRYQLTERLSEVSSPTALIWGREDQVTPPDVAELFASTIPNADLQYISECGHAPMIETPHLFGLHIVEFLRRVIGNGVLEPS